MFIEWVFKFKIGIKMKFWFILINDFCYDLFIGLWFGSFMIFVIFCNKVGDFVLFGELIDLFFWFCFGLFGVIMMIGIFWFFYYCNWDSVEMVGIKKCLLKVKYVIFGLLMLVGIGLVIVWVL